MVSSMVTTTTLAAQNTHHCTKDILPLRKTSRPLPSRPLLGLFFSIHCSLLTFGTIQL
jgi:hypothetical protein